MAAIEGGNCDGPSPTTMKMANCITALCGFKIGIMLTYWGADSILFYDCVTIVADDESPGDGMGSTGPTAVNWM